MADFDPTLQRLIESTETNLFFLVKMIETHEHALVLKQKITLPLGVLNKRFGLPSNSPAKNQLTDARKKE